MAGPGLIRRLLPLSERLHKSPFSPTGAHYYLPIDNGVEWVAVWTGLGQHLAIRQCQNMNDERTSCCEIYTSSSLRQIVCPRRKQLLMLQTNLTWACPRFLLEGTDVRLIFPSN